MEGGFICRKDTDIRPFYDQTKTWPISFLDLNLIDIFFQFLPEGLAKRTPVPAELDFGCLPEALPVLFQKGEDFFPCPLVFQVFHTA